MNSRHTIYIALFAALLWSMATGCDPATTSDADTGTPGTDATTNPKDTTTPSDVQTTLDSAAGVQSHAETVGCNPDGVSLVLPGLSLKGLVVTSPRFDAFTPEDPTKTALDGYFVADAAGGPYSGLYLTIDRAQATDYKPGDQLDVTGDLEEFFCFTQLAVTTHTKTGTGTEPAVETVTAEALATEANESRIVKLENIEVLEKLSWGGYKVTGGVEIAYGFVDNFLSLTVGNTYTLTGAVKYGYGKFQLIPRSDDDIMLLGGTEATIVSLQSSTASTGCDPDKNENVADGVSVTGLIAHERFSVTDTVDGYYMTDGTQDPNSGIYLVVSKSKNTNFALGTEVKVVGSHKEYYCVTELFANTIEEVSQGGVLPAPVEMTLADLMAAPEAYEGMLITVTGVEIGTVEDWEKYGYWGAKDSELNIEAKLMSKEDFPAPTVGDTYVSVTGFLTFGFGTYRLRPRNLADLAQ